MKEEFNTIAKINRNYIIRLMNKLIINNILNKQFLE